ncbi:PucR family transcriptional regulator [Actinokineospora guangxiensis]|uniref:PucR family transcriptional regulator n=1 Tax=Actinokineospora guangxiensis TaxID=1490288 RepID=A0ABW0EPR5_9PSEU
MIASLPPVLDERVRAVSGDLVREVVAEIQAAVPVYRPDPDPERDPTVIVVRNAGAAIFYCLENPGDSAHPDIGKWEATFREAGRLEFVQGRTMDALQTAVRVGARSAWRRLRVIGAEIGVPTDTMLVLADRIFAYVDELCAVAIAGYTNAQATATGAVERRRKQLLKMLLADPPVSPHAIRELAETTDWTLPRQVHAVAVEPSDTEGRPGPEALADLTSTTPCLVVAEWTDALAERLPQRRIAVGPAVPLERAAHSLSVARRALALVHRGVLRADPVLHCQDHLPALVLLADEYLLAQIVRDALAPFDELTQKQRERLTATLLAWLETRGGVNEVACRLAVHPQTVRYRMHQLEELLGDRLDDPAERLTMEIALRGAILLAHNGSD